MHVVRVGAVGNSQVSQFVGTGDVTVPGRDTRLQFHCTRQGYTTQTHYQASPYTSPHLPHTCYPPSPQITDYTHSNYHTRHSHTFPDICFTHLVPLYPHISHLIYYLLCTFTYLTSCDIHTYTYITSPSLRASTRTESKF